ncbi:MAG: AI-2E family transporter, partial [Minicystis sp.]
MSTLPPEPGPLSRPLPDDPAKREARLDSMRAERRALGILAVVAIASIVWIASPVGVGILLGMLLAFSLQPFYERMVLRNKQPGLTALGFVFVSAAGLLATLGGVSSLLISRGVVMMQALIASLAPGGRARALAERLSGKLGPLQIHSDEISAKLRDAAADLAAQAASIAATVATTTFEILLALFFAMMTLSFVLRHWATIAARAEDMVPLRTRYT